MKTKRSQERGEKRKKRTFVGISKGIEDGLNEVFSVMRLLKNSHFLSESTGS